MYLKHLSTLQFVTYASFFAVVVTVFSLIQIRLDKRKHARLEAEKRRATGADWRGGW